MLEWITDSGEEFGYVEVLDCKGMMGRTITSILRHPGRTAAALLILVAAAVIVGNAAFFQAGDHPSPFFATEGAEEPLAVAALPVAADPAAVELQPAAREPVDEIGRLVQIAAVATPQIEATAASVTVVEIQQRLAAQGYDPGVVDGLFGTRTQRAIEAYQADWGLAVTGEISDELLSQLRAMAAEAASPAIVFPTEEARLLTIQTALNQSGYGPVTPNGRMSAETIAAIRDFQLEYGLAPTGEVDQQLIDRMVAIGALEPF